MESLLENPFPMLIVGILAWGFLIAAYVITPHRGWLWGMVPVVLVPGLFFLYDAMVVTPREEITAVVDEGIAALEANDADRIMKILKPTLAHRTRARVEWAFANFTITRAKANDLQISVNELTVPPTATAEFFGTVRFNDKGKLVGMDRYACKMVVYFEKREGKWLIVNHEERSPLGGQREY
ncbi:MAG: hypothetical protein Q4D98_14800 [Planctomycetia bacterium]|nr:hypothetical protein [Planctomycetia bacterium]